MDTQRQERPACGGGDGETQLRMQICMPYSIVGETARRPGGDKSACPGAFQPRDVYGCGKRVEAEKNKKKWKERTKPVREALSLRI
ncbi:Hypothetical predicted protein [Podarcis lilfordi]|uniref:Uncharacterized protein n=1 Tax=Podarcis lilfordi TaxID=74358 RepID=A0AA35KTE8_9SAUR|nr:Hypothetical predicted protein [Podarcis lilfordi]